METIKKSCNNNKFKISAPTWNGYLYIQDYFGYILKKHGENFHDSSIRIYVNKIENIITFKIKTRYYF